MKAILQLLTLFMALTPAALLHAGGSISWDEVKRKISETDAKFVEMIEKHIEIDPDGTGVRLGPHFGEREGERVAPFYFTATGKADGARYMITIDLSPDFEYTGRYFCSWQPLSQAAKRRDWILKSGSTD